MLSRPSKAKFLSTYCAKVIPFMLTAGGGVALLYASKELEKLLTANFDQKVGVQIIQNALKVMTAIFLCQSSISRSRSHTCYLTNIWVRSYTLLICDSTALFAYIVIIDSSLHNCIECWS